MGAKNIEIPFALNPSISLRPCLLEVAVPHSHPVRTKQPPRPPFGGLPSWPRVSLQSLVTLLDSSQNSKSTHSMTTPLFLEACLYCCQHPIILLPQSSLICAPLNRWSKNCARTAYNIKQSLLQTNLKKTITLSLK